MESITGNSSRPSEDRVYSTEGGEVGSTSRVTAPFAVSSRSRVVSTLGEMPGMSWSSSPKRRGPPESCQTMLVDHAPPSNDMQACMGQPGGGGGALLFLSFRDMGGYREVSGVTTR